ncbi:MAG: 50S ribosomal protein L24 [Bdellovibrionales bacterium]|nr:50S ribosomal protein L24 [Bdellovibrionales bacterium]
MSIRKGDMVQVIAGSEKGKSGKVLRVDAKLGRVMVEKMNLVKRHVRPNQENPQGGVVEKEAWLNYSNVLLFCPKCNRGVRHGMGATKGKDSKKSRVCKKCSEKLDPA